MPTLFLVVLLSEVIEYPLIDYLAKPVMMPLLLAYLLSQVGRRSVFARERGKPGYAGLVACGLFFSWIGDLLLLVSGRGEIFFVTGMAAFLLAHLSYCAAFLQPVLTTGGEGRPLLSRRPYLVTPFVLLLILVYPRILPSLGALALPVLLYAVAILTMAALALNLHGLLPPRNATVTLSGALLFLAADTILALNRFALDIPASGFLVMVTYMPAQFLITEGAIPRRGEKAINAASTS